MSFYQRIKDGTVKNALSKYGFPVILTRLVAEQYRPGQPAQGTHLEIEGLGLLDTFRTSDQAGEVIESGDLLLWYTGLEPAVDDRLTLDDAEWRVVSVEKIKPGGVTVLWGLQIRR